MELSIEKTSLIKEVQREFNSIYPYLKIEFYRHKGADSHNKPKEEKIGPSESIGKLSGIHSAIKIKVQGSSTVALLEKEFKDLLGLTVKLFRKSGTLWIETTLTENWTLEKQNTEGELLTRPVVTDKEASDKDDQWMEVE